VVVVAVVVVEQLALKLAAEVSEASLPHCYDRQVLKAPED